MKPPAPTGHVVTIATDHLHPARVRQLVAMLDRPETARWTGRQLAELDDWLRCRNHPDLGGMAACLMPLWAVLSPDSRRRIFLDILQTRISETRTRPQPATPARRLQLVASRPPTQGPA